MRQVFSVVLPHLTQITWRGSELPELHGSTSLLHRAFSYLEDEIKTRSRCCDGLRFWGRR